MNAYYKNSRDKLIAYKGNYEPVKVVDKISYTEKVVNSNPSNFKTEYNKSLINLDLKGYTEQKSYEGYNLFDKDSYKQLVYPFKEVGFYVDNLTVGETYTISSNVPLAFIKVSRYSGDVNSVNYRNVNGFTTHTFRMAKHSSIGATETQYLFIGLVSLISSSNTNGIPAEISQFSGVNICIVKGNEAKPYEPYVGGKPSPNVDYPQPINSSSNIELVLSGANLFDISKITGWKQVSTGQVIYTAFEKDGERIRLGFGAYGGTRALFKSEMVYEESEYTISFDVTNLEASQINMYVRLVDMEKKKGVVTYYSGNDESRILPNETRHFKKTMSVPAGTYSLQIQGTGNASSYQNMSLWAENIYVGKANVDYEPYIEPTTVKIPIELNKLGDVADELVIDYSAKTVKLIKRIEKFYLKDQIKNVDIYVSEFDNSKAGIIQTNFNFEQYNPNSLCTHCKWYAGDNTMLSFKSAGEYVYLYGIEQSTVEELREWIESSNIQVASVLAEPSITEYKYDLEDENSAPVWVQNLLNLSPARNQTNVIIITSDLSISEQNIKYAKWSVNQ